ncbi:MAG TPA: ATP-binding protein [candidate division Zixibacteria bacterium]
MRRAPLFWKVYIACLLCVGAVVLFGAQLEDSERSLWVTLIAGAIVALAVTVLLAKPAIGRLRTISTALRKLAAAEFGHRVEVDRHDEIGGLAHDFNVAAGGLHERFSAISGDRAKLASILSGMIDGVVAVDADARVIHINQTASRLLGAPAIESLGRPVWEITRITALAELLADVLATGLPRDHEARIVEKPRDRHVALYASPLLDEAGHNAGAVAVLHDVSELRRLEQVRRDFVANVSHELKTPITAIQGLVETLLDDSGTDGPTRQKFLERVRHQSERLSNLATDLLSLSRLEADHSLLEPLSLDWRSVITESITALGPLSQKRGVLIRSVLNPLPVEVIGDRETLRQVIDNLLDNAIKHTPSGGQVTVSLSGDRNRATLEVTDTGIGIDPVHQERIFERFYRVDTARSREMGGTGLGLAIVKHVVLAHSGTVTVDSTPGHGSTFRVTLPLASAAPPGR